MWFHLAEASQRIKWLQLEPKLLFSLPAVKSTNAIDNILSGFVSQNYPSQIYPENSILSGTQIWLIRPGPKIIKVFSCSTQLSMKFKMLISMKISRNSAFFSLREV